MEAKRKRRLFAMRNTTHEERQLGAKRISRTEGSGGIGSGHLITFSGEGNGNPLQLSCLENSMDGGAWWATVHMVAGSWT